MSWTFNHNLNILFPRTSCKFTKSYKLFNLWYIRSIHNTSRTAGITKTHSDIIFPAYVKDFIIIFKKWIFVSSHFHPCIYDRAASWDDVHKTLVSPELFGSCFINSAMDSHKVNTILSMHSYDIEPFFCSDILKSLVIVYNSIIYRNSSYYSWTFSSKFLSELSCITKWA